MSMLKQKVNKQSKKYKKFFEKAVPFYPYKKDDQTYVMIRYSRFNKPTQNLILSTQGELIPYEKAIPIFQEYIAYDSCILDCKNYVVYDMNKSNKLLEQIIHTLSKINLLTTEHGKSDQLNKDIDNVLDMARANITAQKGAQSIYEETKKIDIEVQVNRGYLTKEDVEKVGTLNLRWVLLNYDALRKDRTALASYPRLLSFCQKHKKSKNTELKQYCLTLINLLTPFGKKKSVEVLTNSLKEFEIDKTQVTPKFFSEGNKGLEEYIENYFQIVDYKFKHSVLPRLRNPQTS